MYKRQLKHITKVYSDNGFKAVDDFNLEVKRGEFVTFLGPSGCGKTTTLRMIAGFELPSSGEILLDGRDIAHLPANKRPIKMCIRDSGYTRTLSSCTGGYTCEKRTCPFRKRGTPACNGRAGDGFTE